MAQPKAHHRIGPRQRQLLELLNEPWRALKWRPGWIDRCGDSYALVEGSDGAFVREVDRRVAKTLIEHGWVFEIRPRRYVLSPNGRHALREAWRTVPLIDQLAELVE